MNRNDQEGVAGWFTAIEPFPKAFLMAISNKGFNLITRRAEFHGLARG